MGRALDQSDVCRWIEEQEGNVSIGQLLEQFPEVPPVVVAEGLNLYIDSILGE